MDEQNEGLNVKNTFNEDKEDNNWLNGEGNDCDNDLDNILYIIYKHLYWID